MTDINLSNELTSALPIADETVLWRRIPPDKKVFDANLKRWRASSDAFCDHRDGSSMSVYDSLKCGGTEAIMSNHDGFLLCSFTARQAREWGMTVLRTHEGGLGHCEVVGKKTAGIKNKFAKGAVWVIGP